MNSLGLDPEYVAKSDVRKLADDYFYELLTNSQKEGLLQIPTDDEIVNRASKIAERIHGFVIAHREHEGLVQAVCDIAYEKYEVLPPLAKPTPENPVTVTVTVPLQEKYSLTRPVTICDTVQLIEWQNSKISVTVSVTGTLFRLCDEIWWRRTLRKFYKRKSESLQIYHGKVHSRKGKYASDDAVEKYKQQKRRNRKFLENTLATNELGQEFTLQELSDTSVSNPHVKSSELICRMRGFEEFAKTVNHKCMFITITCPSRMHARLSVSGDQNPKYDGTTPKEAQEYLVRLWSQIRAKLDRMNATYYGFRIAEPQHDATPHWHMALFMPRNELKRVTEVIRDYSMREDGDEAGAALHRFKAEYIDPKKGSATGYIIKYIMKNVNGDHLDSDIDGGNAKEGAQRVQAWANRWNIRQFQQIGGPPVSLWRELRRLGGNGLTGLLKQLWQAVNDSQWNEFVKLLGGPKMKRKDLIISLFKEVTDRLNQYLEPIGKVIKGITYGTQNIVTRIHKWVIGYKAAKEGGPNGTPPNGHPPIRDPLYTPAKGTLPYSTHPIGTPINGTPLDTSRGGVKFLQLMRL